MLITVFLIAILKIYVFASFSIPSPSMAPALIPGDYILVNKFDYQPVKRNDVLIFNFSHHHIGDWSKTKTEISAYYAKRCLAIPGDTFCIDNGVNKVKGISDTLGYYQSQLDLGKADQHFLLQNRIVLETYPYDSVSYKWTIKNFGPLYIPKSGVSVSLDAINIQLYKNLIEYETEEKINILDDRIYLGKKLMQEYTFLLNYYFMAGDYVLDSKDSRYWGLLPEDHIVGKVFCIWKSKNPNTDEYRFERFFKSID